MTNCCRSRAPLIFRAADIPKEELDDFKSRLRAAPPRPLAVDDRGTYLTYRQVLRAEVVRRVGEGLKRRADDGERDSPLYACPSPSDSCVSLESTLDGEVEGMDIRASNESTLIMAPSDLLPFALAVLASNGDSSSGPTSSDDHVELCAGPSETDTSNCHSPPPALDPPALAPHLFTLAPDPPAPAPIPSTPAPIHSTPAPNPLMFFPNLHAPVSRPPSPTPPFPASIAPTPCLRRSARTRTRPAAYITPTLPVPHPPTAAKANSKRKVKAKGKAGPSKASTSSGTSKANDNGPHVDRETTPGSDVEEPPSSSKSPIHRPPKRRSSDDDDDDDEYVDPPTKRQKMEPVVGSAATKVKKKRENRIRPEILAGLVGGEVRGSCPWPGCEHTLQGVEHGPLIEHFVTHGVDESVFKGKGKNKLQCPACEKEVNGSCFAEHVLETHLGARWRCLLWDDKETQCPWTGGRGSRVAQHMPDHKEKGERALEAARRRPSL